MSRYIERAEHTARLIAVKLDSMVEQTPGGRRRQLGAGNRVADRRQDARRSTWTPSPSPGRLAFDRDNDTSMVTSLALARDNARQVREALSNEVWENLNRLYLRLTPVTMDSIWVHTPARLFREVLEEMHTLEGVAYSTLSHGEGWYFLELGRHIERVQQLGRLLDIHFSAAQSSGTGPQYFDWLVLLKFCTAFEPYTKQYTASIRPQKIAEFLLFDSEFPHSICFSVDRMTDALARGGARRAAGAPRRRSNGWPAG